MYTCTWYLALRCGFTLQPQQTTYPTGSSGSSVYPIHLIPVPSSSQAFGPWSTSGSSPLLCASLRPTATSPAYDTCSVAKLIPMPAPEVVVPYTRPVSGAIPLAPACYCSTEQTQICSTRRAWHPCTYVAHQPRLGKMRLNMAYWSRNSDWGCHRPRLVWPLAT